MRTLGSAIKFTFEAPYKAVAQLWCFSPKQLDGMEHFFHLDFLHGSDRRDRAFFSDLHRSAVPQESSRQLFYMSTVMPFFLIFSSIGYVPLGAMASWGWIDRRGTAGMEKFPRRRANGFTESFDFGRWSMMKSSPWLFLHLTSFNSHLTGFHPVTNSPQFVGENNSRSSINMVGCLHVPMLIHGDICWTDKTSVERPYIPSGKLT